MIFLQFSAVEDFENAKFLAGDLLDTYITRGIQLAWMMVTRIPPMIASEPTVFHPVTTILESCTDSVGSQQIIALRPTLFFSYEGEVAVPGIIITLPTSTGLEEQHTTAGDVYLTITVHMHFECGLLFLL